jgi:hypothetical protein
MTEKTLTQVFGSGATQNATTLTILKADLANFTGTTTNSADSLAVAIMNLLVSGYPTADRQADKDVSLVANLSPIPSVEGDFTVTPNVAYKVWNYSVGVYKLDPATTPSPNDF